MEISIVDAENVPPGCLLSLGPSGTSKRQGPLVPREKFSWRSAGTGRSLKVDIFSVLGSTQISALDMSGSGATHTCEVVIPFSTGSAHTSDKDAEPIRLGLSIQKGQQKQHAPPALPSIDASPLDVLPMLEEKASCCHSYLAGRSYLEQHRILDVLADMLRDLMEERPEDPWRHLATRLSCESTDANGKFAQMSQAEDWSANCTPQPPSYAPKREDLWQTTSSAFHGQPIQPEPEAEASRPSTAGAWRIGCIGEPEAELSRPSTASAPARERIGSIGSTGEPEGEASRPPTAGAWTRPISASGAALREPEAEASRPPTAGGFVRPMSASWSSRPMSATSRTARPVDSEPGEQHFRPSSAAASRSRSGRPNRPPSRWDTAEFLRSEALILGEAKESETIFGLGTSMVPVVHEEGDMFPLAAGGFMDFDGMDEPLAGSAGRALRKALPSFRNHEHLLTDSSAVPVSDVTFPEECGSIELSASVTDSLVERSVEQSLQRSWNSISSAQSLSEALSDSAHPWASDNFDFAGAPEEEWEGSAGTDVAPMTADTEHAVTTEVHATSERISAASRALAEAAVEMEEEELEMQAAIEEVLAAHEDALHQSSGELEGEVPNVAVITHALRRSWYQYAGDQSAAIGSPCALDSCIPKQADEFADDGLGAQTNCGLLTMTPQSEATMSYSLGESTSMPMEISQSDVVSRLRVQVTWQSERDSLAEGSEHSAWDAEGSPGTMNSLPACWCGTMDSLAEWTEHAAWGAEGSPGTMNSLPAWDAAGSPYTSDVSPGTSEWKGTLDSLNTMELGSEQAQAVRSQVWRVLAQASASGRLKAVVAEMNRPVAETEAIDCAQGKFSTSNYDIEAIRSKTQQLLVEKYIAGELERILAHLKTDISTDDPEAHYMQAKQDVLEAPDSGTDTVLLNIKRFLLEASDSGAVAKAEQDRREAVAAEAIAKAEQECFAQEEATSASKMEQQWLDAEAAAQADEERSRLEAEAAAAAAEQAQRLVLDAAAKERALAELKCTRSDDASLASMQVSASPVTEASLLNIKRTLLETVDSGKLETVLAKLKSMRSDDALPASVQAAASPGTESLLLKVERTLQQAGESGKLETTVTDLNKCAMSRETEVLRLQAQQTFQSALDSGTLVATLATLKESNSIDMSATEKSHLQITLIHPEAEQTVPHDWGELPDLHTTCTRIAPSDEIPCVLHAADSDAIAQQLEAAAIEWKRVRVSHSSTLCSYSVEDWDHGGVGEYTLPATCLWHTSQQAMSSVPTCAVVDGTSCQGEMGEPDISSIAASEELETPPSGLLAKAFEPESDPLPASLAECSFEAEPLQAGAVETVTIFGLAEGPFEPEPTEVDPPLCLFATPRQSNTSSQYSETVLVLSMVSKDLEGQMENFRVDNESCAAENTALSTQLEQLRLSGEADLPHLDDAQPLHFKVTPGPLPQEVELAKLSQQQAQLAAANAAAQIELLKLLDLSSAVPEHRTECCT